MINTIVKSSLIRNQHIASEFVPFKAISDLGIFILFSALSSNLATFMSVFPKGLIIPPQAGHSSLSASVAQFEHIFLIIVSMLLLIVAGASLSFSLSSLADAVAICAFFALVAGVVLQLACFLKYNRKNVETIV